MKAALREMEYGVRRVALPVLLRLAVVLTLMVGLSACAIPPAVSIASLAADGVLLVATGKSKTDHGLSIATGKDCATFRIFDDQNVCHEEVVAQAEPMPAQVERELDRLRSPALAQAPAPRAALAIAFNGQAAPPIAQAQPRRLTGDEVRLAQGRAPAPVVAVAAATPGPFKVATAAPSRSGALVKAGYKSGRAIAANTARLKAAKASKRVAAVGAQRKAGKKVAVLGGGTAKTGLNGAAVKSAIGKVSALPANRAVPLQPTARKVSSAAAMPVQLAMR